MTDDLRIDRVARALWMARGGLDGFFDILLSSHKDSLRAQGRAAIAALQEPSDTDALIGGNAEQDENAAVSPM